MTDANPLEAEGYRQRVRDLQAENMRPVRAPLEEPTIPGWYRTLGAADFLLYSLADGKWFAHAVNGETVGAEWDYIEQAGAVELVACYPSEHAVGGGSA